MLCSDGTLLVLVSGDVAEQRTISASGVEVDILARRRSITSCLTVCKIAGVEGESLAPRRRRVPWWVVDVVFIDICAHIRYTTVDGIRLVVARCARICAEFGLVGCAKIGRRRTCWRSSV